MFDEMNYNHKKGTAMGIKCAPSCACLVVGYKQDTKLFPIELPKLPKFFSTEEFKIIKEVFRRYTKNRFLLWPAS